MSVDRTSDTAVPCGVCGEEKPPQFLETVTLYDYGRTDESGYYPKPYRAPVCVSCRRDEGLVE